MRARRWLLGSVVLAGVLALGVWWARGPGAPAGAAAGGPRAPLAPQAGWGTPLAVTPQRSEAGLRLRGTVVDPHGRPVAGARVSASWPEPGQTLSELPCPEGSFWSYELDPGDPSPSGRKLSECMRGTARLVMELVAAREGEAPVYAEATTPADGTFTLEALPRGPLTLHALGAGGAVLRTGIPAGTEGVELVLEEGMTVEGLVHENGAPVDGATVTVLDVTHSRFFDTRTGNDGRFRAGPLPSSAYFVLVSKEGWLPRLVPVQEEPLKVSLFRPGGLTGRVVAGGAPVPGVTVRAAPGENLPGAGAEVATTDAQGRFTFSLPVFPHTLSATRDGRSAVARAEPGTPAAEVVLELGSAMHVEGAVLDDARRPLAGVRMTLMSMKVPGLLLETVTGEDGRYRAGPVEPGDWLFTLKPARHAGVDRTYPLTPDMGPLDFTLPRAVSVSGRATTSDGRPVPGLQLQLAKVRTPIHGPSHHERFDTTRTDEEGRFILDAAHPGSFVIDVQDERFTDQSLAVRVPTEDVRVVLLPGATVTGAVVDARGLPLKDFAVRLYPLEGGSRRRTGLTDAQGRFLIRGVEPERYMLCASRQTDGLERLVWREVELREGVTSEVELRLDAERTLAGVVVDGAGRPVEGAFVRARRLHPQGAPWWQEEGMRDRHGPPKGLRTGPDGRFTLRHLTEAGYDVSASKHGYRFAHERSTGAPSMEEGQLRAGTDTAELRLVLERQPHLLGRLLGPDGAPLPRFTLNHAPYTTAEDGTFAVPLRNESDDPLLFEAPDLAPLVRAGWRSGTGQDVDLGELRMGPGRRLRVRVLDAETSEPVEGAFLELRFRPGGPGDPTLEEDDTGEDGTLELIHVDTQAFLLTVRARNRYLTQHVSLAEAPEELVVRLDPGAEVVVTSRPPLPSEGMVFFDSDDGDSDFAFLDEGRLVARGLPPGTYVVRLGDGDEGLPGCCSRRIQVPAHGRVTVNFGGQAGASR